MATTERMSFLPMIKCSTCGTDIEISQLADHVCAPLSSKSAEPNPLKLERAATYGGPSLAPQSTNQPRTGRMPPPPRINPSAANKPFRPLSPLSPQSAYNDQTRSPLSPTRGRLPFKRSATSPMPRTLNPPSPDLPPNMDCAFPPFPTSARATPKRGKSRPRDRLEPNPQHRYAEADPLYAPLSPLTNGGENVAKRMDSIAPGPFDGRGGDRRPSTADGRDRSRDRRPSTAAGRDRSEDRRPSTAAGRDTSSVRRPSTSAERGMPEECRPSTSGGTSKPGQREANTGHRRTVTQSSTRSNSIGPNQRASVRSNRSRSSTFSGGSVGLSGHSKQGVDAMPPVPPVPQQIEQETEGIDAFLNRLQKETLQPSTTTPQDNGSGAALVPLENKEPVQAKSTQPTEANSAYPISAPMGLLPGRGSSASSSTAGRELDYVLGLPRSPTFAKDPPVDTMHTASDSGSSDDSVSSGGSASTVSSRSSPAASMDSSAHSRAISKIGGSNYATEEPIPRVESPESFTFMDPRTPPKPGRSRGVIPERIIQPLVLPFHEPLESPMDPAIQHGLLYQRRPSQAPSTGNESPMNLELSPAPRLPEGDSRQRPNARTQGTNKGKCRGCADTIVGKSVKDSSGRLTGRYHKQCFVCRTCRSPFPSAEFYVFDNSPYCEQHYHELNGSLCKSCNRGVEGQYLETDQRWKFHPRCFTCHTCRVILRDDYYEVGGHAYCDRHAYAAQKSMVSLAPGNSRFLNTTRLQKRSTRLMMMM